jgi:hypothetical protein
VWQSFGRSAPPFLSFIISLSTEASKEAPHWKGVVDQESLGFSADRKTLKGSNFKNQFFSWECGTKEKNNQLFLSLSLLSR